MAGVLFSPVNRPENPKTISGRFSLCKRYLPVGMKGRKTPATALMGMVWR